MHGLGDPIGLTSSDVTELLSLFSMPENNGMHIEDDGHSEENASQKKISEYMARAFSAARSLCEREPELESLEDSSLESFEKRVYRFEFYDRKRLVYYVPTGHGSAFKAQIHSTEVENRINKDRAQFFDLIEEIIKIQTLHPPLKQEENLPDESVSISLWDSIPESTGWNRTFAPFTECLTLWEPSESSYVSDLWGDTKTSTILGSLLTLAHYYVELLPPPSPKEMKKGHYYSEGSKKVFMTAFKNNSDNQHSHFVNACTFITSYTQLRNTVAGVSEEELSLSMDGSERIFFQLNNLWSNLNDEALRFAAEELDGKNGHWIDHLRSKNMKRPLEGNHLFLYQRQFISILKKHKDA